MSTGKLYVVATPLGNLEDMSRRAIETLRQVSVVCAEDTRRSRILLDHFGVPRPLMSLHEHNERARTAEVLDRLTRGESVALLTDAGTPAVSDPGAELVRAAVAQGFVVSPIPGASALSAALSVAGFAGPVLFIGFLPPKGAERARGIADVVRHPGVVVLFEAPHRIQATLAELAREQPERAAMIGRELTKIHEEVKHSSLSELAAWAEAGVRGELTVVLGPPAVADAEPQPDEALDAAIDRCLAAGLSPRDAAAAVAAVLDVPRRRVYARVTARQR